MIWGRVGHMYYPSPLTSQVRWRKASLIVIHHQDNSTFIFAFETGSHHYSMMLWNSLSCFSLSCSGTVYMFHHTRLLQPLKNVWTTLLHLFTVLLKPENWNFQTVSLTKDIYHFNFWEVGCQMALSCYSSLLRDPRLMLMFSESSGE